MRANIVIRVSLFLFSLLIASCEGQHSKNSELKRNDSTAFIRDIPLDIKGRPVLSYTVLRQIEEKLGLPVITNGFDSIQLRIWFSYSGKDSSQMVLVQYQDSRWDAKIYSYLFGNSDSINKNSSVQFVSVYPKSGWNEFISKIDGFGILTLPDMDKVNNGKFEIYEGDVVTVEYSTRTRYRLYQYVMPYSFQNIWKEAKDMENIVELIEKELSLKRLRIPPKSSVLSAH